MPGIGDQQGVACGEFTAVASVVSNSMAEKPAFRAMEIMSWASASQALSSPVQPEYWVESTLFNPICSDIPRGIVGLLGMFRPGNQHRGT